MKMLLNEEWVDRTRKFEVRDPQDNSLVDTVPLSSVGDMKTAIAAAVSGFEYARQMPVHERMTNLNNVVSITYDWHETLALNIAREGIKTIHQARKEVTRAIETMHISAEEARRITGETIPFDQMPGSEGRLGYFSR